MPLEDTFAGVPVSQLLKARQVASELDLDPVLLGDAFRTLSNRYGDACKMVGMLLKSRQRMEARAELAEKEIELLKGALKV